MEAPLGGWRRRLVRMLLALYPRAFREGHEEALRQTCADALEDRGSGLATWVWLLRDTVTTSLRVRADVRLAGTDDRKSKGGSTMWGLGGELASAVRSLARAPVFAVVVILTMGLGIGANTAVFSVVYRVLSGAVAVR